MLKVEKRFIEYRYENENYSHYILCLIDFGSITLLSPINIYLKTQTSMSLKTSERYANNLARFLNFLLDRRAEDRVNFWRSATERDLREWQQVQVKERDLKKKTRPSDKTISANASLVLDAYAWLQRNNFPIVMNVRTKEWKFNYKVESRLTYTRSQLSENNADHLKTSTGHLREKDSPNKFITIMSLHDQLRLMSAYIDPVYRACFLLALATGMREEGVCKIPYIGCGRNFHIRPYPDILAEIDSRTFNFTVIEKGKQRTLKIQMDAWKAICEIYLPYYYERRRKFQLNHPKSNPDEVFFLTKAGHPVTPHKIASQTTHAKAKLKSFPWSFHSTRSWYATQYMLTHLTKGQIHHLYYDAAVEEGLRHQIGHSDIKTTYRYYLRIASIMLATKDGDIGQTTFADLTKVIDATKSIQENPG